MKSSFLILFSINAVIYVAALAVTKAINHFSGRDRIPPKRLGLIAVAAFSIMAFLFAAYSVSPASTPTNGTDAFNHGVAGGQVFANAIMPGVLVFVIAWFSGNPTTDSSSRVDSTVLAKPKGKPLGDKIATAIMWSFLGFIALAMSIAFLRGV